MKDYDNTTFWTLHRNEFSQAGIEADLQAQGLWYLLSDIGPNTFQLTTNKADDEKVREIVWDPKNTPK